MRWLNFREWRKKQHHLRLLDLIPEMKNRPAEQNKILLEFLSPETNQEDKKTSREEKAMILFTNAMSICPLTDIMVFIFSD
jgi:predicted transposase YdaD